MAIFGWLVLITIICSKFSSNQSKCGKSNVNHKETLLCRAHNFACCRPKPSHFIPVGPAIQAQYIQNSLFFISFDCHRIFYRLRFLPRITAHRSLHRTAAAAAARRRHGHRSKRPATIQMTTLAQRRRRKMTWVL